jgi:hypothetical protein
MKEKKFAINFTYRRITKVKDKFYSKMFINKNIMFQEFKNYFTKISKYAHTMYIPFEKQDIHQSITLLALSELQIQLIIILLIHNI